MPRRKPEIGEFPEPQYYVDVTLSEDRLNGSGRLVGKVRENNIEKTRRAAARIFT
ncbi:MAG: hypothetical protein K2N58_08920 [Treponemataceae bacterium]|nr:hypothetical protein [Treponemataceae bacterium]